ncbi:MAG: hypothetical protein AMJ61_04190 [Desulfobacterales bacterium SG8_35_2]|jgi:ApbE superfamily uncharacterized protein (UPF0280 family)|nr:MAG: hypothetical protein AMJ61_04190 [Desulfobacterales bacterium SG8_35_2]
MNREKRKKISPPAYNKRTYRQAIIADDLVSTFVTVKETDLHILAARTAAKEGYHSVHRYRNQLENYISTHPDFLTALVPLAQDTLAPPIVKDMLNAATAADVGPMAAVAGAIAQYVGRDLLDYGLPEIMVENGGDIFIKRNRDCVAAIFAGQSPLNQKVGIRIPAALMPVGLCTSSGTIGHSLSLGMADSVTVLAPSALLADAAATRLGNEVATAGTKNINHALTLARSISGLLGVVIICGKQMGVWGEIDLVGLH